MKQTRVPIAVEGYPFIFFCAFLTLVFGLLELTIAALGGIIITGFVIWFFRDPERIQPDDPAAVISPADGKIILVEKIFDDRFTNKDVHKISIFMNVFNVHVNRIPYRGTIESITLKAGKFYSADTERGALQNEYCAMTVNTEYGESYGVVQVAGLIARRIICWAEKKDHLGTGERYGLIRFGSRVDLYLPLNIEIIVNKGQRVRAGETILGHFQASSLQV
jgi:phosphatidylserine decarboxylase